MTATSAPTTNRPVYFAMTVPERYYMELPPYMRNNGLACEAGPLEIRPMLRRSTPRRCSRNVTELGMGGDSTS